MTPEIPSQGIKDLYAANLAAGRTKVTDDLLIRFPSLADNVPVVPEKVAEEAPVEVEEPPKKEVKSGKVRKR